VRAIAGLEDAGREHQVELAMEEVLSEAILEADDIMVTFFVFDIPC
jgi:hypothetical protein